MRRARLLPGMALVAPLLLAVSHAGESAAQRLPGWTEDGWKPFEFGNIERHTRYTTVDGGSEGVWLRAESDCAASARILALTDRDLHKTPLLAWRWRVDEPLRIEDERSKRGDDFAARVYVMFRFQPERASWLERLRHRLGAASYDLEPPGSALSLVWSSREPEGAIWKSPYGDESAMVVVASGARKQTGRWYSERVDLVATYRAAFGAAPPPLLALGVMTDADNTCSRARAGFHDFSLSPRD